MVSRRTAIAGGAGAVLLAALGYRIWDRGVFAGASGEAYTPWSQWRGSELDGRRRPLRAAILAANPHDTQPWIFEASENAIKVIADRSRNLGSFDPFRREMQLGLGCAIENLVRAAGVFGIATSVRAEEGQLKLSPGPEPVTVAHITLDAGPAGRDELFEAIANRHTNRGPYLDKKVAPEMMVDLVKLTSSPDVNVVLFNDGGARKEMGAIVVEATQRIIADPQMSLDSYHWIRTGFGDIEKHRDGVTIDASGIGKWITMASKLLPDLGASATDQYWLSATRDVHTATAPMFGMILVRDRLDMAQAIEAGRAWQRLHLAATARGLAAQPLNQPVEMVDRNLMLGRADTFKPALAELARMDGWEPTFVFRMGYAEHEAPPSPRRSLEDVIISRA
ncbi:MAG: nitroreductase family protein [Proteobacteria bacterium]|nr:nitroreductase family protein [Pseudomonadota bacterium]